MKRALVLVLTVILMAAVSTGTLAAVHNSWGDFSNRSTDRDLGIATYGGWYYIEPETPYAIANLRNNDNQTEVGALYYLNDFTFAELGTYDDSDEAFIRGSYRFNNGVFAGLDAGTRDDDYAMLSLGYLYDLGNNGYIALSGDYDTSDRGNGWLGVDLDFRYYTNKMRIFGQIYHAEDGSNTGEGLITDLAVNYKLQDNLVAGVGVTLANYENKKDATKINFGGTYTVDALTVDGEYYYRNTDTNGIALMGMYNFSDELAAGLYGEFDDDDYDSYVLKVKYNLDQQSQLRFSYELNNENELQLAYYRAL
ncbi:MAG TPA: hypothetical protein VIM29_08060 [Bacillota bacterium]